MLQDKDPRNPVGVGKKLYIREEEFEDLDEIIQRFIAPKADYVQRMMHQKKFREMDKAAVKQLCLDDKQRKPGSIPYYFIHLESAPGKFLLSYCPGSR